MSAQIVSTYLPIFPKSTTLQYEIIVVNTSLIYIDIIVLRIMLWCTHMNKAYEFNAYTYIIVLSYMWWCTHMNEAYEFNSYTNVIVISYMLWCTHMDEAYVINC